MFIVWKSGKKDLAAAIADGDMHSIMQAFAEGARPESIIDHKTRKTCLHLAVEFPSLHVVEFLLQNAPDAQNDQADYPGPTDAEGNTILHKAIAKNLHPVSWSTLLVSRTSYFVCEFSIFS